MAKLNPVDSFRKNSQGGIVIEMDMEYPNSENFDSIDDCIQWFDDTIAQLEAFEVEPLGHTIPKKKRTELAERYKNLKYRILNS